MKKLKFTFTEDETNIILGALGDYPYKVVADLIQNIRNQAIPQVVKEKHDGHDETPRTDPEETDEEA